MSDVVKVRAAAAIEGEEIFARGMVTEMAAVAHADALAGAVVRAVGMVVGALSAEQREEAGLVLGTERGCLETDWAFDRSRREDARYASPAAFSRTLPSTVTAEAGLRYGLRGPSMVVCGGAGGAAAVALRRAAAWMEGFSLRFCVAGGFDVEAGVVRVGVVLLERGGAEGEMVVEGMGLGELVGWVRGGVVG